MISEILEKEYQRARHLYATEQYEEALKVLEDLITRFPEVRSLLYARALCLIKLERFQDALEDCQRLIRECPNSRSAAVQLMANILVQKEESNKTIPHRTYLSSESLQSLPLIDSPEKTSQESLGEEKKECSEMTEKECGEGFAPQPEGEVVLQATKLEEESDQSSDDFEQTPEIESVVEWSSSSDESISGEDNEDIEVIFGETLGPQKRRIGFGLFLFLVLGILLSVFFWGNYVTLPKVIAPSHPDGGSGVLPTETVSTPEPSEPPLPSELIWDFPEDRVLGAIFVPISRQNDQYENWEQVAYARGEVRLKFGDPVRVEVYDSHWVELDRLFEICGSYLYSLKLANAAITSADLQYMNSLTELRELDLDGTVAIDDDGLKSLGSLRSLRSLVLRGIYLPTTKGYSFLSDLAELEKLDVEQTSFSNECLRYLVALSGLKSIRLPDSISSDWARELSNLSNLKELSIGYELAQGDLEFLKLCEGLEILECRGGVSKDALMNIGTLKNLRSLRLKVLKEPEGLEYVANCPNLRDLFVEGCVLGTNFWRALGLLKQLETLGLDVSQVKSEVGEITAAISELKSLHKLVLRGTLPEESILSAIVSSPNLEILELVNTFNMNKIAAVFSENLPLRQLRLVGGWFSQNDLMGLTKLPTFKRLEMINVSPIELGVEEFAKVMPNVEIYIHEQKLRNVDFPRSYSNSLLYIATTVSAEASDWELIGRAIGSVLVPIQKKLMLWLDVASEGESDRLMFLRSGDLQSLVVDWSSNERWNYRTLEIVNGIESLMLIGRYVTDGIVPVVASFRGLRYLSLIDTEISDVGLSMIPDFVSELEGLLIVRCKNVTDASVPTILRLSKLRFLEVSETGISDENNAMLLKRFRKEEEIVPSPENRGESSGG